MYSFIQLSSPSYVQLDVIGIDEAQFFEDLYDFCCKAADQDGKTVIVAGLDGDYLRCLLKLIFSFSYVTMYCVEICFRAYGSVLALIIVASHLMFTLLHWQKELWLGTWHNTPCWFCNQVDSSLWTLWQAGFLYFEEDRRYTDGTDWWGWCLYACLPPALYQWTSCHCSGKECSRIPKS